jgi:hypothetical protein
VTEEAKAHEVSICLVEAPVTEIDAGTDMALKIRVSCSSECDLRGMRVFVADDEGAVVEEVELAELDGAANETDEFVVKVPSRPADYGWAIVFPAQEKEGISHEESSAPFSFSARPHLTSIAVWDVPSPVAFHDKFTMKVGVKCSAGCSLAGHKIEIYNQGAEKVATATLGDTPWPGTSALYWAELQIEAPSLEGYHVWTARFPRPDLELPHEEASYSFGLATGRAPEHLITVEVIEQDGGGPIGKAQVVLRPQSGYAYRALTDESGAARVGVPTGQYTVLVSKGIEYVAFETTVEAGDDTTVRVELVPEYRPYG